MSFKLVTIASSAVLVTSLAAAQAAAPAAKAPTPDYTIAYNVGAVSDYRFRGISQTSLRPAIQAGADFSHKNGLYLGVWASNVA